MKTYLLPKGFNVVTHSQKELLLNDKDFRSNSIKYFIDLSGVTHSNKVLELWSISDLLAIGVKVLIDNGFDKNKYEIDGDLTYDNEPDGSFKKNYENCLVEKTNYIGLLREEKRTECKKEFNKKIDEGFIFNKLSLNVQLKCDKKSIDSFLMSINNISLGNDFVVKLKDFHGNITNATSEQVQDIYKELNNYYLSLLDKKFEYYDIINNGDENSLKSIIFNFDL